MPSWYIFTEKTLGTTLSATALSSSPLSSPFSSIQFSCSVVSDSLRSHHQLPEFTQTHVHQVSDAIQPSHPLSSPLPPAPNPSPASGSILMSWLFTPGGQRILTSASASVFLIDIQDLCPLGLTGLMKSLLQHDSSKGSILRCSAFFMVQLSHPYMTTGKTVALTRQSFVSKTMSLLFNTLSRFVIAFLPRSKVCF